MSRCAADKAQQGGRARRKESFGGRAHADLPLGAPASRRVQPFVVDTDVPRGTADLGSRIKATRHGLEEGWAFADPLVIEQCHAHPQRSSLLEEVGAFGLVHCQLCESSGIT